MKWRGSGVAKPTAALAVAVAVLAGSLVFVELAPRSPTSPATVTSTSTSTTTTTATETVEKGFTTPPAGSETVVPGNGTMSSVSTNGIELTTSINATGVSSGEGLAVALSISNTLPTVNNVATSNDWSFQGVPVALWPACYFSMPAEVAVLDGNYSADELPLVAGAEFQYQCAEGGTVHRVAFQPQSDKASLTGVMCGGSCINGTMGTYGLSFNFTTKGYWDLEYLANSLNVPILGQQTNGQPYSLPFVPGVYTVAVADEWGQVDVLHFEVVARSPAQSVSLGSFSLCVSDCYYPAPLLAGTVYFNSTSPVRGFQLTVNGTNENGLGLGFPISDMNVPFVFKDTLTSRVVAGDDYAITFDFYFNDSTSATAAANVVAR